MKTDLLFQQFTAQNRAAWQQQALKELKGEAFEKLIWQNPEGFSVEPMFFSEDMQVHFEALLFAEPHAATAATRHWRNAQTITVDTPENANKVALEALANGADEIIFDATNLNETLHFEVLLRDILLNYCAVSFICKENADSFLERYLKYVSTQNIDIETLTGSLIADSFAVHQHKGFRTIVLASPKDNATTEIVWFLEHLTTLLAHKTEQEIAQYVSLIVFKTNLNHSYFLQIAKLRALRLLATEVARVCGGRNIKPQDLEIHAVTSIEQLDEANIATNLISNTLQGMAAILGGCNTLSVLPHDFTQKPLATRMARNVSLILQEESFLGKINDAAAGSYYIETLTDKIAENAWEIFKKQQKL